MNYYCTSNCDIVQRLCWDSSFTPLEKLSMYIHTYIHRFWPFMRQNTSFGARKCLLGVRIVKKNLPLTLGGKHEIQAKNPNVRCQIVKSSKKGSKWRFLRQSLIPYMFFGTRNPNLRSFLKPEVELMVYLRMRSDKITKKRRKTPLNAVLRPIFRVYISFSAREIRIWGPFLNRK